MRVEPRKGYIRWWKTRVMDWIGDNEGIWVSEHGGPYGGVVGSHFESSKFEDKPYADWFKATMTLAGSYRGRSAAGLTFKDETGREHTMRLSCVAALMGSSKIDHGVISGTWTYVKQGSNFSLKYVSEAQ